MGDNLGMHKPDHYSLLTVVLSFTLGALSSLNAVAETYLPLFIYGEKGTHKPDDILTALNSSSIEVCSYVNIPEIKKYLFFTIIHIKVCVYGIR